MPTMNEKQALKILRTPIDLKTMPRAKARVAIAKDVIAGLKVQKLIPAHHYGEVCGATGISSYRGDTRTAIGLERVQCEVCGIGALFMAYVARENNHQGSFVERATIRERLAPYFDFEELNKIEQAYESTGNWGSKKPTSPWAAKFYRIQDDGDRMVAVMQYIIRTKGAPLGVKP